MNELKSNIIKFYIILCMIVAMICCCSLTSVYASEITGNHDVIADLSKDTSFSLDNYPSLSATEIAETKNNNTTADDLEYLNIIQIAESKNYELAIYVYEPMALTKEITATSLNMSTEVGTKEYKNYDLTLLDRQGTLSKYLVEDFVMSGTQSTRFYDISNIYRAYDETLDGKPLETNTISYVGMPVGKLWSVQTSNGQKIYHMSFEEYITITISYHGSIRYVQSQGMLNHKLNKELFEMLEVPLVASGTLATDSHYVVFNTDKQMDELLEADVYFETTDLGISYSWASTIHEWEKAPNENYVTVNDFDNFTIEGGWFHKSYEFGRIAKAEDFLEAVKEDVDDTTIENINKVIDDSENTAWALRYCETDYLLYVSGDSSTGNGGTYGVKVENATILRLKFKTNGVTYNLGVVDNMTSHDNIPDGIVNETKGIMEKILELVEKVMMIVSIIVLLVVLGYVFPFLNFILAIFKALWKVITLPFRLIGRLFKRKRY